MELEAQTDGPVLLSEEAEGESDDHKEGGPSLEHLSKIANLINRGFVVPNAGEEIATIQRVQTKVAHLRALVPSHQHLLVMLQGIIQGGAPGFEDRLDDLIVRTKLGERPTREKQWPSREGAVPTPRLNRQQRRAQQRRAAKQ